MAEPQDPNNPYPEDPNAGGTGQPGQGGQETEQILETGVPEVSASPRRVLLIIFLVLGALGFIIYSIFSGGDKKSDEDKGKTNISSTPDITPLPQPPAELPTPEPIQPPQPPIAPAPLIQPPPTSEAPPANDEDRLARLKSNLMVVDAAPKPTDASAKTKAETALASSDPNLAFAQNAIKATGADKAKATRLANLNSTIGQGKIIDAVLETAINTDLPGTLRAIVSRDIYPESGRNPLIPKGSRLVGTYNTGILRGQKRIFVIWTRVIRPDGIDVAIGSPGIDQLGRAGIEGYVDNKYTEIFSTAILTSLLSIGTAVGADAALGNDKVTTTQNTDGSVTQTGSAGAIATADSVAKLGAVGQGVLNGVLDQRPTITVDQGTKINVMVNRDLEFPASVLKNAQVVP